MRGKVIITSKNRYLLLFCAAIAVTACGGGGDGADSDDDNDGIVDGDDAAPSISAIADQNVDEDATLGPVAFTVDDAETAPGSLTVSATSDTASLIRNDDISLGGSGSDRTLTLTPVADANGIATITVTVDDGFDTASTAFRVTVNAVNDPPTITSPAMVSTPENQRETGYTATAQDPDVGDTLTFSIVGGTDADAFIIDGSTGALRFDQAPDFENPADANGDNVYGVSIGVADGNGGNDNQTVTVTVTDAPDEAEENQPPAITSSATASVPENNTAAGYTATADDPNGDTVSFSLTGGDDQAAFIMDTETGVLRFSTAPDFENPADANANNDYTVEITANDGNGGTDSQTVTVTVTDQSQIVVQVGYPTFGSNLGGSVSQSVVRGVLVDEEDGEVRLDDVDALRVNGETALQSMDDPSRWSAVTPVGTPGDSIGVSVESRSGDRDSENIVVTNQPPIIDPVSIVRDGDRMLVLDDATNALYAVIPNQRIAVSDAQSGDGPAFDNLVDMTLDAGNERMFVLDELPRRVLEVDLLTGDRQELVLDTSGTSLSDAAALVLDTDNQRLLLLGLSGLYSVDLATGAVTTVSDQNRGGGPLIESPQDVVLDAANNRAIVVTVSGASALFVDLANGNRTVVRDGASSGPDLNVPLSAVLDSDNDRILVVDGSISTGDFSSEPGIIAAELASGNTQVISGAGVGAGFDYVQLSAVTLDATNNRVLSADTGANRIIDADLTSGERDLFAADITGNGRRLGPNAAIALDAASNRALVVSTDPTAAFSAGQLLAVDLLSANRSVLSDEQSNAGPDLRGVQSVAFDPANNRVVVLVDTTNEGGDLLAVSLDDGSRSLVASDIGGTNSTTSSVALDAENQRFLVTSDATLIGVNTQDGSTRVLSDGAAVGGFSNALLSVAVDTVGRRAIVVDGGNGSEALYGVDLESGQATRLSGLGTGSGPAFNTPQSVAVDPSQGVAYVVDDDDFNPARILAVDLANGAREVISGSGVGDGPSLIAPRSIAVEPEQNRALVVGEDSESVYVIDLDSGQRAIASH